MPDTLSPRKIESVSLSQPVDGKKLFVIGSAGVRNSPRRAVGRHNRGPWYTTPCSDSVSLRTWGRAAHRAATPIDVPHDSLQRILKVESRFRIGSWVSLFGAGPPGTTGRTSAIRLYESVAVCFNGMYFTPPSLRGICLRKFFCVVVDQISPAQMAWHTCKVTSIVSCRHSEQGSLRT